MIRERYIINDPETGICSKQLRELNIPTRRWKNHLQLRRRRRTAKKKKFSQFLHKITRRLCGPLHVRRSHPHELCLFNQQWHLNNHITTWTDAFSWSFLLDYHPRVPKEISLLPRPAGAFQQPLTANSRDVIISPINTLVILCRKAAAAVVVDHGGEEEWLQLNQVNILEELNYGLSVSTRIVKLLVTRSSSSSAYYRKNPVYCNCCCCCWWWTTTGTFRYKCRPGDPAT